MDILFTRHILEDSSKRINNPEKRKNEKNIKNFYRGLFTFLMTHDEYKGHKIKHFTTRNGKRKVVGGKHKFVYAKKMTDQFLLITYARKTEFDNQIHSLIKTTKYYAGKKNQSKDQSFNF